MENSPRFYEAVFQISKWCENKTLESWRPHPTNISEKGPKLTKGIQSLRFPGFFSMENKEESLASETLTI